MPDFDPSAFSSVDPQQFAQLVKSTPDDKLKEVMRSEERGKILDEIFSRFPKLFRADRAGATNAAIQWHITERPDGGTDEYEVVIADGTCVVNNPPQHDPKLTLTMAPVDFLKIVSGAGNPMMMFMTGKLKAKGDLALAANVANLFDLPKA
ncbi:MAG TPA: SCP2 sterol-binding domain-containing protein [Micromonosporaceae bacterium]|nr:SCP2 sterol-binding domain-containing protein [Micromonosporaceae bacterium]